MSKSLMNSEKKPSVWVWISLTVIILLFVGFIIFLDQKIVKKHRTSEQQTPQSQQTAKPVFDFYTVLPERKVDIPDSPQPQIKKNSSTDQAAVSRAQYILQAGSFNELNDADRQKAELAMLGLEASINTVNVNGKTYHRVELGPFEDDGFYSQAQKRLIENDIQFLTRSQ